ncbi:MAG: MBL fold metallo-hydrolase, partial [Lachnospiraceae bacterium]|nr:MBL fold metallo-hydrolase [Lachnospiraceae bacterium]
HFDHCEGIEDFREAFPDRDIEVIVHEEEKRVLEDPELNLSDSLGSGSETYHADRFVKDHEKLSIAGFDIEVLLTPGHTPGGCCYYFPGEKAVFCGDTLFAGSVGRTDFPEGSMRQLIRSVKEQLFVLPEDTRVFPGHEGTTTIGDEKRYNFFVQ